MDLVGTTLKFGRRWLNPSAFYALVILLTIGSCLGRASANDYRFLTNGGPRVPAAAGTLPGESPTRIRIDLDSTWDYFVDGGPSGEVLVPSAYDFTGRVAFQRRFQVPADLVSKYQFHLMALGINQNAEITINNDFITNHSGGYTTVDQTVPVNTIQAGQDNVLRVVVNNALDYRRGFPLRPLPWMPRNYGGILRDIYLIGAPPLHIGQTAVSTFYDPRTAAARVRVRIRIDHGEVPGGQTAGAVPGPLACSAELIDKISGITVGRSPVQTVNPADTVTTLEFAVGNPKVWTPDSPELYLLRCSLSRAENKEAGPLLDEFDMNCGIRQIQIANGRLTLNGARLVLKGVIWNEDHPAFGSALSYEQMEKDVAQIKTLGANVIRFIYHTPHPYMLDLCDRYGLLAMEELPVASVPGPILADEGYREAARALLRETITRDRNHPSVLAWGLGDGNDMTLQATRDAMQDLAATARSLDNRPLYAAAPPLAGDICTDLMDIAAVTVKDQDVRDFRSKLEAWQAAHPDQVVIVAAFGTQVQQDNHRGYTDPLSQEAQARFYLQRFDVVKSLDYDGAILQAFNDWTGERPSLTVQTESPWEHTMGLVSAWREKRLAFDAVRASFHGEKFAALPLGTYSSKASIYFVLAGFAALVGIAYLYNASRRFRESLNRSLLNSYNFFSDVRDQHLVSPVHTLLLGIGIAAGTAIVMASIAYHFRDSAVADNLLTFLLVSDTLKAAVVRLIWRPLTCMGVTAAVVFAGFVAIGIVMLVIRVFFRQRTYLSHTLTIAFWSAAPFLAFIPIGMILYRVMESPAYVVPMLVLVAVLHVWVVLRILKGLSIVYDVFPPRMYALGILVILVVTAGLYLYYDAVQSLPMYARTMYDITTHIM